MLWNFTVKLKLNSSNFQLLLFFSHKVATPFFNLNITFQNYNYLNIKTTISYRIVIHIFVALILGRGSILYH